VDQLAYIEWLLYTEPGDLQYRDHFVHMFKVAFAGAQLLSAGNVLSKISQCQLNSVHFLEWCSGEKIPIEEWQPKEMEDVIKMAFFLAALFHDFGYGYFFLRKYTERLSRVYRWLLPWTDPADVSTSGTRTLLEALPAAFIRKHHGWLNSESDQLRNEVTAGFFRDCLPLNHSVASTFFVLDIAEELNRARALGPKLYVSFQLAAEACMIHDMMRPNSWVHLKKRKNEHFIDCDEHKNVPLAILLILSDELSIWNRPSLSMDLRKSGDLDSVSHWCDKDKVPSEISISVNETEHQGTIEIVPNRGEQALKHCFEKLACLRNSDQIDVPRILDYAIRISS
jgi:hypothetical protein